MTIPETTTPVRPSDLLAELRDRLMRRAGECSTYKQHSIVKGWWHEAHEAEVRRGIWLMAAEMASQELSAANITIERPSPPTIGGRGTPAAAGRS